MAVELEHRLGRAPPARRDLSFGKQFLITLTTAIALSTEEKP